MISSRKRVPPEAVSMMPFFWMVAPVKAPFSWPNSSLVSSSSVSAPQLIAKNGPSLRLLDEMDVAGQKFLAGARLAGDQHVAVGRRDLRGGLQQLLHHRVLGDDLDLALELLDLLAQLGVLLLQRHLLQGRPDGLPDIVEVERLGDVIVGALLHRLDRRGDGGVGRDHDDLGIGIQLPALLQDLDAVDLLHLEVRQHDVELLLVQKLQRVGAAERAGHLVAFLFHHVLAGS